MVSGAWISVLALAGIKLVINAGAERTWPDGSRASSDLLANYHHVSALRNDGRLHHGPNVPGDIDSDRKLEAAHANASEDSKAIKAKPSKPSDTFNRKPVGPRLVLPTPNQPLR